MVFKKIRKAFSGDTAESEGVEDEYLEIDLGQQEKKESKVQVKLFVLKKYDDVTPILNALREGYTIAVVDIHELRKKDAIELKRAVSKIKKTTDALEGSIAGFGENTIVVTPAFASIDKASGSTGGSAESEASGKSSGTSSGEQENLGRARESRRARSSASGSSESAGSAGQSSQASSSQESSGSSGSSGIEYY